MRVSRNVIFFENQYFFPSHVQLSSASVSLLPIFSESPTIVEWFKPGFVYERPSRHESGSTSFVPPSDLHLAPDPAPASTTLRRSTRPLDPLIGMVSSLLSLLSLLYPLFPFPLATNRIWNMCKTRENSNFLKNGKIVILVKIRNYSRSRMMKRTSPLESSI